MTSKNKTKWQAPNQYIQYLHDNTLISLELYYTFFANHKQADYEAFWNKTGYFICWLN